MSLTLIEQTILDTFPQAWLEQAQKTDAIHAAGMSIAWDVSDSEWIDPVLDALKVLDAITSSR